ncbi:Mom family adenine methylcarbamoylation protein [Actinoplanes sp. RD1]|uniref:Mom family adenine methylcarbamoylation protein n=1 Tax=Actinoplanes sp. RD1 TaxID=3064538 RepID=UPI0027406E00|nr:hypothetical protein [Actinoplanes sp. RD1]
MAKHFDVGLRALIVRTLLHLPRVASGRQGTIGNRQVRAALETAAHQLRDDERRTAGLVPQDSFELRDLKFAAIRPEAANTVLAARHYLRSARAGSLCFALLDPRAGLPVSIGTVSPLQWRRVAVHLRGRFGIAQENIMDVSRVYSCDTAPPNAISYLLARMRDEIRRSHPRVELLTTAVDTNLGFTGASYRAANWQQWITVGPRPYLYHNKQYVSPRQLRSQFGTAALPELQKRCPDDTFEQSRVRLADSLIFCLRMRGKTEALAPESRRRLLR